MQKSKKETKKLPEILRYLSCSVVVTAVSWSTYTLLLRYAVCGVFFSNLLSWILATLVSFFVNKLWVFQSFTWNRQRIFKEAVSFFSARIFSGAIEIFGVPLLEKIGFDRPFFLILDNYHLQSEILHTAGLYSKIGVGFIVLVLNYVVSKMFVFIIKIK